VIRDYVIKILDIPLFSNALQDEIDNGTAYVNGKAYARVTNGEPVLLLDETGIIPRVGNAAVSIKRIDDDQYSWLVSLPQLQDLGRGNPYIKEISDVAWETGGEGFYHAVHLQTPYEVNGETITPPELHCIIWSD